MYIINLRLLFILEIFIDPRNQGSLFHEYSDPSVTKVVMAKLVLQCTIEGCDYATPEVEVTAAVALLTNHTTAHQLKQTPTPAPTPTTAPALAPSTPIVNNTPKASELSRPKLKSHITNEEWNAFSRRWDIYRSAYNFQGTQLSNQLFQCASEELGDVVLRVHPQFTTKPHTDCLTILKSLAVIPVALGVQRSELLALAQSSGESFRTFAARVTGKAESCEFSTTYKGTCSHCNAD